MSDASFNNWQKVVGIKGYYGVLDKAIETCKAQDIDLAIKELAFQKINEYQSLFDPSALKKLWYTITGRSSELEAFKSVYEHIKTLGITASEEPKNVEVKKDKEALALFLLNFEETFHTKPKRMTEPEKKLLEEISKRIWDSPEVQGSKDKYETYKDYMKQYYSGAHFHFEQKEGESILAILKNKINYIDDKNNPGRDQLAARVSSHFVKYIGEVNHVHLAGSQIPEVVMSEVELRLDANNEPIKGVRADIHKDSYGAAIDNGTKKYFWIQTENNPDGPDWMSYLKHRTIDFTIYTFRKLMKFENVNVGPYGYGKGDKDPIIISAAKD